MKLKKDFLNNTLLSNTLLSNKKYHDWINKHKIIYFHQNLLTIINLVLKLIFINI
jgi:hypothetical protein